MRLTLAMVFAALLAGCSGGKTVDRPAVELGEELFERSALSSSSFNDFACSTCHARTAADEGDRLLPGFPLADSAHRPSWWNGYEAQYLDSVNFCLVFFMRGIPLAPGDPDGDALYEYLASISPTDPAPALSFTIVNNIQVLPAGDAAAGESVYDRACRTCHGANCTGKGRINSSATVLDEALSSYYDTEFPGIDHELVVSEKVRHGQFFGIGGNMPPFARERLSDEDLADLIAFLDL